MYLNQCNIIGRLVATVDFTKGSKEDGSNDRVWGRVACNRPGSDEADFVPFVAWGGTARAVAKYCGKGKVLILTGRLSTRSKKREDGSYDNYAEINCSQVFFGPDAKNVAADAAPAVADAPAQTPAPAQGGDLAAQMAAMLMKMAEGQAPSTTPAEAPAGAASAPPASDNPFA